MSLNSVQIPHSNPNYSLRVRMEMGTAHPFLFRAIANGTTPSIQSDYVRIYFLSIMNSLRIISWLSLMMEGMSDFIFLPSNSFNGHPNMDSTLFYARFTTPNSPINETNIKQISFDEIIR